MTRTGMSYRVVRLDSAEANRSPAGSSDVERSEMMMPLAIAAWVGSGRTLPSYTRATMPIRLTTLAQQGTSDDA